MKSLKKAVERLEKKNERDWERMARKAKIDKDLIKRIKERKKEERIRG